MSIRVRLAVWYTTVLAMALSVFAVAIWMLLWQSFHRDLERAQEARILSAQHFIREELNDPNVKLPEELKELEFGLPDGVLLQVLAMPGSRPVFSSSAAFPWQGRDGWVWWKGQRYNVVSRLLAAEGMQWRISFASSFGPKDELLHRLAWLLVGLTPAMLAVGSLGGIWLSRRALKPVDDITAEAKRIGIHDLSSRLPVEKTGDELQRLSETWNEMLERLEDAVKRLGRFTADASHELRTPLAVIRSTAEIAGRRSRSEEAYRKALDHIVTEASRMTELIDDLLFLARCDADDLDLPMEAVRLDQLVDEVSRMMQPVAEARSIRLEWHGTRSGPVLIWGNGSAVRRMLLILVDNAVKYCRPAGRVNIWLEGSGTAVQMRVSDEGYGISQAELPLVFQRFYRGEQAREGSIKGHGLGLALASGIAERHGASICVTSVPEQGSTFEVSLPAMAATEPDKLVARQLEV